MATEPDKPGAAAPPRRLLIRKHEALREKIGALVEDARHDVVIFAPWLDGRLFNTATLAHQLAGFAARDRRNRVRVLVEDAEQAVRDNDRIVDLCRRMSDFVQMRRVGEDHIGLQEMFVVLDRTAWLHQPDLVNPECLVSTDDRRAAGTLTQRFEEMWERSEPIPAVRTVGL